MRWTSLGSDSLALLSSELEGRTACAAALVAQQDCPYCEGKGCRRARRLLRRSREAILSRPSHLPDITFPLLALSG